MKKALLILVLIIMGWVATNYWFFLVSYIILLIKIIGLVVVLLSFLLGAIWVKDRLDYIELKKTWK